LINVKTATRTNTSRRRPLRALITNRFCCCSLSTHRVLTHALGDFSSGRPSSSAPRSILKQAFHRLRQQTASLEIPIASDAPPRSTPAVSYLGGLPTPALRARRATVMGPASANLHKSDGLTLRLPFPVHPINGDSQTGPVAWNDGTRDSLVVRYRVPTAPLASDAMTASACPPCWGRLLALGGTSRQSIISAKSASLLSLLQRKRSQTEVAQKRAAQCDGGYPSSEKKETNFAMSFPLPARRTGRKTGDAMLRADSGRVAMKLRRPSPASSHGLAHPKPSSWRQAGSPRCLRWACLHPSGRST
jgi:hypothetical protein